MINRLPFWLKQDMPDIKIIRDISAILRDNRLNTVCQAARCPNQNTCFKERAATFMILGKACTRTCRFCSVEKGRPSPIDIDEPRRIAKIVKDWGLDYVVITSVTRDDLIDGGAAQFVLTIKEIQKFNPLTKIEVLIPDLQGNFKALSLIIDASPDVISHNIETVKRLYKKVRPKADYQLSLMLLKRIKETDPSIITKSGIMLGLGERFCEVIQLMQDLKAANCDILTLGQYLKPKAGCLEVERFIMPEEFKIYKRMALSLGFKSVASSPLVRSSYKAKELLYA